MAIVLTTPAYKARLTFWSGSTVRIGQPVLSCPTTRELCALPGLGKPHGIQSRFSVEFGLRLHELLTKQQASWARPDRALVSIDGLKEFAR